MNSSSLIHMRIIFALAIIICSSTLVQAAYTTSFKIVDKSSYPQSREIVSLDNLPRVRSQGAFGACAGYSSAAVAQYYQCKHSKIQSCSSVTAEKEISPIQMMAYSNRNNDRSAVGDLSSYSNIKFSGAGSTSLRSLASIELAYAESCYPFDQVVNKYGDDGKAVDAMLDRLREMYQASKRTEGSACLECIQKAVQEDLKSNVNLEDIRTALRRNTFEEFLFQTTLGRSFDSMGCEDIIEIKPKPKVGTFPEGIKIATPVEAIAKIKEVIKSGYPIVYDGMCPYSENGKCLGYHSVALTGYKKQCTADGKSCRELVRVQNSWGEEWQRQNDDGWVDAQTFLQSRKIEAGSMTWLYSDK